MRVIHPTKIIEWLKETNGYAIMKPEFFTEMGFDFKPVKYPTDPSLGKFAAIPDDEGAEYVEGVAEFDAVENIADMLGVSTQTMFMGRGKNFRIIADRIIEKLEGKDEGKTQ